jgi:hypothetical protein
MPVIDLVEMGMVGLLLLGSVVIVGKLLVTGQKSLMLAAEQWLYLWLGGGVVLMLLEFLQLVMSLH